MREPLGGEAVNIVWTAAGQNAVEMVVRRDTTPATATLDRSTPPTSSACIQRIEATRSVEPVTGISVAAGQPKVDLNRLTDDVYRMLERRLITERERRGR